MSRIKIDTEHLDKCIRQLEKCDDALADARRNLQRIYHSMQRTCQKLIGGSFERVNRSIRDTRSMCNDLSSAIRKAEELFEEYENDLLHNISELGTGNGNESAQESNIWESPWLSWLDSTLDFLGIDEYGRDYDDPGEEAQRARDELMQEEMGEIFQDEDLNEEAWNKASSEEKQKILNEILQRINKIQGTKVNKKIKFYTKQPDSKGVVSLGFYRDFTRSVHINTYMLDNYSYRYIMDTVVHEMRHAYQHEVTRHPDDFAVSESTAKSWDKNFDDYISYSAKKNNYQAYRDQPVEADARGFAAGVDYT